VPARFRRRAVWAAAAAGLLWAAAPGAWADEPAFRVADPAVAAVAGLARDPDNGLWWLAQPGDGPSTTVVGVDAAGQTAARLTFQAACPRASAVAWQTGVLFVGDLGDPERQRASVWLYGLPAADAAGDRDVPYEAWELAYDDGPHDAQALLAEPSGRLLIVTTGPDAGFYALPADLAADGPNRLTRVGDAPAGVTDGLSLSDELMALRTESAVLVLDAASFAVRAEAPVDTPGDGLALSADGTALLLSGRGPGAVVATAPVPTDRLEPAPVPAASAPPAAAEEFSRSGTFMMLGAAAVLAVCAGLLAFLRR
jgi:hypothetical protein